MKKILFLDDDQHRHDVMKRKKLSDIDYVYDAKSAIEKLDQFEYDLVMLDHDLGGVDSQNRMDCPEDGRTVARWIAEHPEKFQKTQFVIHSLNMAGSQEMRHILLDAGLLASHRPFAWKT